MRTQLISIALLSLILTNCFQEVPAKMMEKASCDKVDVLGLVVPEDATSPSQDFENWFRYKNSRGVWVMDDNARGVHHRELSHVLTVCHRYLEDGPRTPMRYRGIYVRHARLWVVWFEYGIEGSPPGPTTVLFYDAKYDRVVAETQFEGIVLERAK